MKFRGSWKLLGIRFCLSMKIYRESLRRVWKGMKKG
jgi:hypothetical protein